MSLHEWRLIGYDGPATNRWTAGKDIALSINDEGQTTIANVGDSDSYVVDSGTIADFARPEPQAGFDVSFGDSFRIVRDLITSEPKAVTLLLLEYDAEGARAGFTEVATNGHYIYAPGAQVAKVIVTLRLAPGTTMSAAGLSVTRRRDQGDTPVGLHEMDREDTAAEEAVSRAAMKMAALEIASAEVRDELARLQESIDLRSIGVTPATATQVPSGAMEKVRSLLLDMAGSLPRSNGSHYFQNRLPFRVAIITDEYMFNYYRDAFDELIYVSPSTADDVIAAGFDILLYVTGWRGLKDNEWKGITYRDGPQEALTKLLEAAQVSGATTIFQTIEDPSNFDYFLPIAQRFQHVFTTDTDCIPKYKEQLGHDRVYFGEYGANPLLNNPVGSAMHSINGAFFAGSYPERYPERCRDMEMVFDAIARAGDYLYIADRNVYENGLNFPLRFRDAIMGPLPHIELQSVHKLFRYSLNFNSITTSPTMCAMRIYELQAQGRGLISNYAKSVLNRFPEVRIIAHDEDLNSSFDLPESRAEIEVTQQFIRNVMSNRTSFEVISEMLARTGLTDGTTFEPPVVAVLGDFSDEDLRREMVDQSYPNIRLVDLGEVGQEIDSSVDGARYWTRVDSGFTYGRHFIQDRVNAFKYVDVDFVTQIGGGSVPDASVPLPDMHRYVTEVPQTALTLFAQDRVLPSTVGSERPTGRSGYAVAPFEAALRPTMARSRQPIESPILSVVIPVYNNGRFLTAKCFPSIQRNARWREYEIILVDDGSDDERTLEICAELADRHDNVVFLSLGAPGSGSASRPRNRGVERATAPLVTFLDPDNEISEGGYDHLLDRFEQTRADCPDLGFVSGYQVKVTSKPTITGRHSRDGLALIQDARARFFDAGRFPVVSTQCAVIDRALLGPGQLEYVEGAAGQDTLYGWELLLRAGAAAFTADAHLLYYAERTDSVTNSLGSSYFAKKLVMEQAQRDVLREHGLLDVYREHHLPRFVSDWYLPRIRQVRLDEQGDSLRMLNEILDLYGERPLTWDQVLAED